MDDRRDTLGGRLAECLDPYKGLLILVVVLDHNDVAHALFPATFRPLTFHVLGFLLLPFLVREHPISWSFARDRVVRYWVPFASFMALASTLFWLVYHRGEAASQTLWNYVVAAAIGSAPLTKAACGFLAYWFLPSLVGVVLAIGIYGRAGRVGRGAITAFSAIGHLFLVSATFASYYWLPFGAAIVANVFVLGLILRWIADAPVWYRMRWLFPLAFVLAYGWLVARNAWLEVMTLQFATVFQPATLIAQDVAGLAGVVSIVLLAWKMRGSRWLGSIGHHSLVIYLLHPLVYAGIGILRGHAGLSVRAGAVFVAGGVVEYAIAVVVSWAGAIALGRSRALSAWITPRNWALWGPVAMLGPGGAARA